MGTISVLRVYYMIYRISDYIQTSYIYIYKLTQRTYIRTYTGVPGECARLRENVPYVKVHRYNPKHLCPKLNGYGDNGERKM